MPGLGKRAGAERVSSPNGYVGPTLPRNWHEKIPIRLSGVYRGERGRPFLEPIQCRRCGAENPGLERPPFRSERGARIQAEICRDCWAEWLNHQTLLINHYGLDPRERKSREFLYAQIDEVLLGEGSGEQIDTSKQGTIEW